MGVKTEGTPRVCHREWGKKLASLEYPFSVFNKNSTLKTCAPSIIFCHERWLHCVAEYCRVLQGCSVAVHCSARRAAASTGRGPFCRVCCSVLQWIAVLQYCRILFCQKSCCLAQLRSIDRGISPKPAPVDQRGNDVASRVPVCQGNQNQLL